jgi:hypothetical protein
MRTFEVGNTLIRVWDDDLAPWLPSLTEYAACQHVRCIELWSYVGPRYIGGGLACGYVAPTLTTPQMKSVESDIRIDADDTLGGQRDVAEFGALGEYANSILQGLHSELAGKSDSNQITVAGALKYEIASSNRAFRALAEAVAIAGANDEAEFQRFLEKKSWLTAKRGRLERLRFRRMGVE